MFFWKVVGPTRMPETFRDYYNAARIHRSLVGTTPAHRAGTSSLLLPQLIATLEPLAKVFSNWVPSVACKICPRTAFVHRLTSKRIIAKGVGWVVEVESSNE